MSSVLRLDVKHVGLGMEFKELAFPDATTLAERKEKLYPRTGTEPANQTLTLVHPGAPRALAGDDATLLELGVEDGARLELVDTNDDSVANNLRGGEEKIEKYEAKSGDAGFAAFRKKRAAAGRKSRPEPTDDTERAQAETFTLGQRVTTRTGKRATVRFVGRIEPLPAGFWVGVELDEPTGKNDGEVKGVRLFTCAENCGAVARPSTLTPVPADVQSAEDSDGRAQKTGGGDLSDTEL